MDYFEYFKNFAGDGSVDRVNADFHKFTQNYGADIRMPTYEQSKREQQALADEAGEAFDEKAHKQSYNNAAFAYKRFAQGEFNSNDTTVLVPDTYYNRAKGNQTNVRSTDNRAKYLPKGLSFKANFRESGEMPLGVMLDSEMSPETSSSMYGKTDDYFKIAEEQFEKTGKAGIWDEATGDIKRDETGKAILRDLHPNDVGFWDNKTLGFDIDGTPVYVPLLEDDIDLRKVKNIRSSWSSSNMDTDLWNLPSGLVQAGAMVGSTASKIGSFIGESSIAAGYMIDKYLPWREMPDSMSMNDYRSWLQDNSFTAGASGQDLYRNLYKFGEAIKGQRNLDQNGKALESMESFIGATSAVVESYLPVVALSFAGRPDLGLSYGAVMSAESGYTSAMQNGFSEQQALGFATLLAAGTYASSKFFQGKWLDSLYGSLGKNYVTKAVIEKEAKALREAVISTESAFGRKLTEKETMGVMGTFMQSYPGRVIDFVGKGVKAMRTGPYLKGAVSTEGLEESAEYLGETFWQKVYRDYARDPKEDTRYNRAIENGSSEFSEKSWKDIVNETFETFVVAQVGGGAIEGTLELFKKKHQDKQKDAHIIKYIVENDGKGSQALLQAGIDLRNARALGSRLGVNGEVAETQEEEENYTVWKATENKVKAYYELYRKANLSKLKKDLSTGQLVDILSELGSKNFFSEEALSSFVDIYNIDQDISKIAAEGSAEYAELSEGLLPKKELDEMEKKLKAEKLSSTPDADKIKELEERLKDGLSTSIAGLVKKNPLLKKYYEGAQLLKELSDKLDTTDGADKPGRDALKLQKKVLTDELKKIKEDLDIELTTSKALESAKKLTDLLLQKEDKKSRLKDVYNGNLIKKHIRSGYLMGHKKALEQAMASPAYKLLPVALQKLQKYELEHLQNTLFIGNTPMPAIAEEYHLDRKAFMSTYASELANIEAERILATQNTKTTLDAITGSVTAAIAAVSTMPALDQASMVDPLITSIESLLTGKALVNPSDMPAFDLSQKALENFSQIIARAAHLKTLSNKGVPLTEEESDALYSKIEDLRERAAAMPLYTPAPAPSDTELELSFMRSKFGLKEGIDSDLDALESSSDEELAARDKRDLEMLYESIFNHIANLRLSREHNRLEKAISKTTANKADMKSYSDEAVGMGLDMLSVYLERLARIEERHARVSASRYKKDDKVLSSYITHALSQIELHILPSDLLSTEENKETLAKIADLIATAKTMPSDSEEKLSAFYGALTEIETLTRNLFIKEGEMDLKLAADLLIAVLKGKKGSFSPFIEFKTLVSPVGEGSSEENPYGGASESASGFYSYFYSLLGESRAKVYSAYDLFLAQERKRQPKIDSGEAPIASLEQETVVKDIVSFLSQSGSIIDQTGKLASIWETQREKLNKNPKANDPLFVDHVLFAKGFAGSGKSHYLVRYALETFSILQGKKISVLSTAPKAAQRQNLADALSTAQGVNVDSSQTVEEIIARLESADGSLHGVDVIVLDEATILDLETANRLKLAFANYNRHHGARSPLKLFALGDDAQLVGRTKDGRRTVTHPFSDQNLFLKLALPPLTQLYRTDLVVLGSFQGELRDRILSGDPTRKSDTSRFEGARYSDGTGKMSSYEGLVYEKKQEQYKNFATHAGSLKEHNAATGDNKTIAFIVSEQDVAETKAALAAHGVTDAVVLSVDDAQGSRYDVVYTSINERDYKGETMSAENQNRALLVAASRATSFVSVLTDESHSNQKAIMSRYGNPPAALQKARNEFKIANVKSIASLNKEALKAPVAPAATPDAAPAEEVLKAEAGLLDADAKAEAEVEATLTEEPKEGTTGGESPELSAAISEAEELIVELELAVSAEEDVEPFAPSPDEILDSSEDELIDTRSLRDRLLSAMERIKAKKAELTGKGVDLSSLDSYAIRLQKAIDRATAKEYELTLKGERESKKALEMVAAPYATSEENPSKDGGVILNIDEQTGAVSLTVVEPEFNEQGEPLMEKGQRKLRSSPWNFKESLKDNLLSARKVIAEAISRIERARHRLFMHNLEGLAGENKMILHSHAINKLGKTSEQLLKEERIKNALVARLFSSSVDKTLNRKKESFNLTKEHFRGIEGLTGTGDMIIAYAPQYEHYNSLDQDLSDGLRRDVYTISYREGDTVVDVGVIRKDAKAPAGAITLQGTPTDQFLATQVRPLGTQGMVLPGGVKVENFKNPLYNKLLTGKKRKLSEARAELESRNIGMSKVYVATFNQGDRFTLPNGYDFYSGEREGDVKIKNGIAGRAVVFLSHGVPSSSVDSQVRMILNSTKTLPEKMAELFDANIRMVVLENKPLELEDYLMALTNTASSEAAQGMLSPSKIDSLMATRLSKDGKSYELSENLLPYDFRRVNESLFSGNQSAATRFDGNIDSAYGFLNKLFHVFFEGESPVIKREQIGEEITLRISDEYKSRFASQSQMDHFLLLARDFYFKRTGEEDPRKASYKKTATGLGRRKPYSAQYGKDLFLYAGMLGLTPKWNAHNTANSVQFNSIVEGKTNHSFTPAFDITDGGVSMESLLETTITGKEYPSFVVSLNHTVAATPTAPSPTTGAKAKTGLFSTPMRRGGERLMENRYDGVFDTDPAEATARLQYLFGEDVPVELNGYEDYRTVLGYVFRGVIGLNTSPDGKVDRRAVDHEPIHYVLKIVSPAYRQQVLKEARKHFGMEGATDKAVEERLATDYQDKAKDFAFEGETFRRKTRLIPNVLLRLYRAIRNIYRRVIGRTDLVQELFSDLEKGYFVNRSFYDSRLDSYEEEPEFMLSERGKRIMRYRALEPLFDNMANVDGVATSFEARIHQLQFTFDPTRPPKDFVTARLELRAELDLMRADLKAKYPEATPTIFDQDPELSTLAQLNLWLTPSVKIEGDVDPKTPFDVIIQRRFPFVDGRLMQDETLYKREGVSEDEILNSEDSPWDEDAVSREDYLYKASERERNESEELMYHLRNIPMLSFNGSTWVETGEMAPVDEVKDYLLETFGQAKQYAVQMDPQDGSMLFTDIRYEDVISALNDKLSRASGKKEAVLASVLAYYFNYNSESGRPVGVSFPSVYEMAEGSAVASSPHGMAYQKNAQRMLTMLYSHYMSAEKRNFTTVDVNMGYKDSNTVRDTYKEDKNLGNSRQVSHLYKQEVDSYVPNTEVLREIKSNGISFGSRKVGDRTLVLMFYKKEPMVVMTLGKDLQSSSKDIPHGVFTGHFLDGDGRANLAKGVSAALAGTGLKFPVAMLERAFTKKGVNGKSGVMAITEKMPAALGAYYYQIIAEHLRYAPSAEALTDIGINGEVKDFFLDEGIFSQLKDNIAVPLGLPEGTEIMRSSPTYFGQSHGQYLSELFANTQRLVTTKFTYNPEGNKIYMIQNTNGYIRAIRDFVKRATYGALEGGRLLNPFYRNPIADGKLSISTESLHILNGLTNRSRGKGKSFVLASGAEIAKTLLEDTWAAHMIKTSFRESRILDTVRSDKSTQYAMTLTGAKAVVGFGRGAKGDEDMISSILGSYKSTLFYGTLERMYKLASDLQNEPLMSSIEAVDMDSLNSGKADLAAIEGALAVAGVDEATLKKYLIDNTDYKLSKDEAGNITGISLNKDYKKLIPMSVEEYRANQRERYKAEARDLAAKGFTHISSRKNEAKDIASNFIAQRLVSEEALKPFKDEKGYKVVLEGKDGAVKVNPIVELFLHNYHLQSMALQDAFLGHPVYYKNAVDLVKRSILNSTNYSVPDTLSPLGVGPTSQMLIVDDLHYTSLTDPAYYSYSLTDENGEVQRVPMERATGNTQTFAILEALGFNSQELAAESKLHDGMGWMSPLQWRLEAASYGDRFQNDAQRKNILGGLSPEGVPMLIKNSYGNLSNRFTSLGNAHVWNMLVESLGGYNSPLYQRYMQIRSSMSPEMIAQDRDWDQLYEEFVQNRQQWEPFHRGLIVPPSSSKVAATKINSILDSGMLANVVDNTMGGQVTEMYQSPEGSTISMVTQENYILATLGENYKTVGEIYSLLGLLSEKGLFDLQGEVSKAGGESYFRSRLVEMMSNLGNVSNTVDFAAAGLDVNHPLLRNSLYGAISSAVKQYAIRHRFKGLRMTVESATGLVNMYEVYDPIAGKQMRLSAPAAEKMGYITRNERGEIIPVSPFEVKVDELAFMRIVGPNGNVMPEAQTKAFIQDLLNYELDPEAKSRVDALKDRLTIAPMEVMIPRAFIKPLLNKYGISDDTLELEELTEDLFVKEAQGKIRPKTVNDFYEQFKTIHTQNNGEESLTQNVLSALKEQAELSMGYYEANGDFQVELDAAAARAKGRFADFKRELDEKLIIKTTRIPVTGPNSVQLARVAGFFDAQENSALVPSELLTVSGADNDGDMITVEFYEDAVDGERMEEAELRRGLFDQKRKFLSNVFNARTIFSPIDFSSLSKKKAQVDERADKSLGKRFGSFASSVDALTENQAGKRGVGIFVKLNEVYHNIYTLAKRHPSAANFRRPLHFMGKTYTNIFALGEGYMEGVGGVRKLINKVIENIANASLDNAKDPILGALQVNNLTWNVYGGMILSGVNEDHMYDLMTHPYVKGIIEKVAAKNTIRATVNHSLQKELRALLFTQQTDSDGNEIGEPIESMEEQATSTLDAIAIENEEQEKEERDDFTDLNSLRVYLESLNGALPEDLLTMELPAEGSLEQAQLQKYLYASLYQFLLVGKDVMKMNNLLSALSGPQGNPHKSKGQFERIKAALGYRSLTDEEAIARMKLLLSENGMVEMLKARYTLFNPRMLAREHGFLKQSILSVIYDRELKENYFIAGTPIVKKTFEDLTKLSPFYYRESKNAAKLEKEFDKYLISRYFQVHPSLSLKGDVSSSPALLEMSTLNMGTYAGRNRFYHLMAQYVEELQTGLPNSNLASSTLLTRLETQANASGKTVALRAADRLTSEEKNALASDFSMLSSPEIAGEEGENIQHLLFTYALLTKSMTLGRGSLAEVISPRMSRAYSQFLSLQKALFSSASMDPDQEESLRDAMDEFTEQYLSNNPDATPEVRLWDDGRSRFMFTPEQDMPTSLTREEVNQGLWKGVRSKNPALVHINSSEAGRILYKRLDTPADEGGGYGPLYVKQHQAGNQNINAYGKSLHSPLPVLLVSDSKTTGQSIPDELVDAYLKKGKILERLTELEEKGVPIKPEVMLSNGETLDLGCR